MYWMSPTEIAAVGIVVISTAAYASLALSLVVYLRLRSLRRSVSLLYAEMHHHREPPVTPAMTDSAEDMSTAVEQWARTAPGNSRSPGAAASS